MSVDRSEMQRSIFVEHVEAHLAKLRRFSRDVTDEEMAWSPVGIVNSLGWILRHCAGLLWMAYGRISGDPVPSTVQEASIAWSSLKGTRFEEPASPMPESADACQAYLDDAWNSLRSYLEAEDTSWETRSILFDRREQSVWAFLVHELCDLCYHTGQASALRKLLAVKRRRRK